MFFVPPMGSRIDENQSKIASQCILNEESKTTPKNAPKLLQNRSRIDLKSEQARKANMLKNRCFSMFFVPPRGRKSIENRPKIVSKSILNEESKRAPKNSSKSTQDGSRIDPSWGHVGLQNRLGAVQERRKNDTERDTEKEAKKTPKRAPKNLTDNEREARLHVKT